MPAIPQGSTRARFVGKGSAFTLAKGFVPNFVNIKAMQELAKRGSTKGERAAAQNLLNKQNKK